MNCRDARQRCSFNEYNWGIATWPEVLKTPEGNALPASVVAAKQRSLSGRTSASGMAKSVSELSGLAQTSRTLRIHQVGEEGQVKTLVSTSVTPERVDPAPSTFEGPATNLGPLYLDRVEQMSFGNLVRIEAEWHVPSRSSTLIGTAMSELCAHQTHDGAALALIAGIVRDCRVLIDSLMVRLEAEGWRLARAETVDLLPFDAAGPSRVHAEVNESEDDRADDKEAEDEEDGEEEEEDEDEDEDEDE